MRPPKRILVAPFSYKVALEPSLSSVGDMTGGCDPDKTRIVLDATMSKSAMKDTLLHESIHAAIAQTDLARRLKDIDPNLEEDVVYALTPRVLSLLIENPDFVAYLQS